MSVPVYALPLGTETGVDDIDVALRLPQEMVFKGQDAAIGVLVRQRGGRTATAQLSLWLDDQQVDAQNVTLQPDGSAEAAFQVTQQESGLYRYEVRVGALAGEVTDLNNRATQLLRVVDEPVRVLLLEGKPYWDTKFLIRTLASDASVNLRSVVKMAENRFLQRQIASPERVPGSGEPGGDGSGAPAQRSDQWSTHSDLNTLFAGVGDLASYQVIVLGRDAEVFLDEQRMVELKKWLVDDAGALVCFRGSPVTQVSQQLAELMPLRWTAARESRFRVQLTDTGRAAEWLPQGGEDQQLLAQLPSLSTVTHAEGVRPLAVVLATSSGQSDEAAPVISYQPIGTGRVVVVEGAGMWRWAFLASGPSPIRRNLWVAVAQPGPLASGQFRVVALPAGGADAATR